MYEACSPPKNGYSTALEAPQAKGGIILNQVHGVNISNLSYQHEPLRLSNQVSSGHCNKFLFVLLNGVEIPPTLQLDSMTFAKLTLLFLPSYLAACT